MVGKIVRRAPISKIDVDTPFITGEVLALCLPDAIYDLTRARTFGRGTVRRKKNDSFG